MQTHDTAADRPPVPLLAGRVDLAELAAEIGACERTARNLLDRLNVPFIKVVARRFYDREEVRRAILATETRRTPRGRGRPRQHAA